MLFTEVEPGTIPQCQSLHPLIVTRARSISVANVNQRVAVVA